MASIIIGNDSSHVSCHLQINTLIYQTALSLYLTKISQMVRIFIGLILAFSCLFSVSVTKFPLQIPRTLWVFWDSQIDRAPIMVQLCVSKMRAVCRKQNWTLIVLNQTNLHEYIPNYETEFMSVRRNAAHPDWKAALSDLIRLHVIAANGGVYMDITTILFEGLGWLDRLDEIPYLLTNSEIQKGVQPDCIVPYIAFYQNSAETRDSEGRITNWLPGYEAWFFAAKKNATFIQKWWKNHQKHFQLSVQQNGKDQTKKGYFLRHNLGDDYLIVDKSAFQVIQQEQAKIDEHVRFFGERKNVNKELKILGLHGEFGPFSLYLGYTPRQQDFVSLTIQQVEQKYFAPIHFFVKLTNNHRNFFDGIFRTLKVISKRFGSDQNAFQRFMSSYPSSQDCNTVKFIVQGSVFGGLIQDNGKAQSQHIFSITVQQRQQWHKYCHQRYHIDLKNMYFYDNLYYYISHCIQVGQLINMVHPWASWLKYKFDEYMKMAFRESILPPRNWMGWLVQPAQTLYWEKRYQKRLQENWNLQQMGEFHGLSEVFAQDYSEVELLWMRVRMWVFEHRVDIITWVLHWIGFLVFFTFFSLIYLALSLIYWVSYNIYNYNIRPLVWLILAFSQPQMILPVKQSLFKYLHQLTDFYHTFNQQKSFHFTKTLLKSLLLHLFTLILGTAFLGYYTFILYYYDVVLNNGKIYEQEWTFLFIILGQNVFRVLGKWVGDNAMILPGIRFKFLYYLFLPVYYYFFGAEMLSLVRPFENQNFNFAFLIAFCMPLIVKLIEHETRYGIKKIALKLQDKEHSLKILVYNLYSVFSNFTSWVEKAVIAFLVVIIFTNLRFMRSSEGYILVRFLELLARSKLPWLALLTIYIIKSFQQAFNAITNTQKIAALHEQSRTQQSQTLTSSKANRTISSTTSSLFSQQINSRIRLQWINLFALQCLKSLVIITKYILRAYTVYVLLFDDSIEYMINHVFQINFDHTFMKITFMAVHFAFVLISFMVEIYLEDEYFAFLEEVMSSTNTVSFELGESLNEDLRMPHAGQKDHEQESGDKKNTTVYKNYQVLLSLGQIAIFIMPRLWAVLKFYSFFDPNNRGVKFEKKDFQSGLIFMMYGVLFGYAILMPFIRKRLKSKQQKAIPSYINGQNQLLPCEDGQIELKQQEENHY